ncbi:FAD-dependent oxidoreductase [Clostridium sp. CM028]|uniref:NAD(P)/FAD-dependent oxidoreductase n=1 Tax=unclassified Clostridium TaxID=2614128 RepID=UPI001C0C0358|nr:MULTISPECIES: FAD-dependent oxidoreductase [unclassified Clostridium]MBU3091311.1 FAD-dependent oxidoreductase [Clostridium sp. CF011]MBW9150169.1 FAD-dependent oxidoreductase [Clostridium sp. CM028]WAG68619.1 FAD-dependent oxidoreductase [Clostridium sp. CF011]WLC60413.1 FAD-dependent oxidoreductase [Clostridium sp. CM028]
MYDITIVGSGVSGMFLAYTLVQTKSKLKILMIEKGRKFIDRVCPMENGLSKRCIHCKPCNKFQGFGGMGRSEGKFNYTNDFGGYLGEKIGNRTALELMECIDNILCLFGADTVKLYSTENEELSRRVKEKNYNILTTKVRHLGTALSYGILNKMYSHLKDKVDIKFELDITAIDKMNNVFNLNSKENVFQSKIVILATGISGGAEFLKYCQAFNIEPYRKRLDLGVRVEMKGDQLDSILKDSFEIKINYKGDGFEATTYCMNPKGKVIKKFQKGIVMADGQNYLETDSPSCNLNFSILVPKYFSCFIEANEYATSIIKSINKDRERIVLQRFEDLINNRATTKEQLTKNSIQPSIEGEGGNLYNEIPKIYIDALLKIIKSIEDIIGKEISEDTLLYGIDAKFYEPEISTNEYFETKQEGLYVLGDCSGTTYSLSQAAASAVYLGRYLLNNNNK